MKAAIYSKGANTMATNMSLDYEAMRNIAAKINGEAQPLQELVSRMQNNINELVGVWDSNASREFENQWSSIKPGLDRLYNELIPAIATQVRQSADAYQAADDAAAAAARGV
jgi:WXG100 family type VII secretion target